MVIAYRVSQIVLQVTPEIHTMAKFLMELCLVDYETLKYPPSMIAASALCLSLRLYGVTSWVSVV